MRASAMSKKSIISWLVTVGLPLVILLIPSSVSLTMQLKLFFAITVFGVTMFCFGQIENAVAGILMMVLYMITGLAPMNVVFSAWTTPIPWFILGTLLLVAILEDTTILKRIAYWCIIRTGGTYQGIIWGVTITAIISIAIIPGTWTCLAVAALCVSIIKAFDLGPSKAAGGIMLAAMCGFHCASAFIYSPSGMGMFLSMSQNVPGIFGMETNFIDYFIKNITFVPLPFVMAFLISKIMKPEREINGKVYFIQQQKELGKMNLTDLKVLVVLLVLMVYLFTAQWHGQNMLWGFLLAPIILYLPGFNIGKKEHFAKVNFSVLFFIVACMCIGSVAGTLNAGTFLTDMILPYLQNASDWSFMTIVYLFGILVNFLLTPLAAMSAIAPVLSEISLNLGITPLATTFSLYIGLDQLLLPYEIGTYLIFFAFGYIYIKDFVKICGVKMLLTTVWMAAIVIPYWMFLGMI